MDEDTEDEIRIKSKEKGNLHLQEEFSKAKRNVLWFCCLAIILYYVHAPDGDLQAPMLGTGTKLSALTLRILVWVAALYNAAGFWRQARNINRLNSQLLYTTQFETIEERLETLGTKFANLGEECSRLSSMAAPVRFSSRTEFERAPKNILDNMEKAVGKFEEMLGFAKSAPERISKEAVDSLFAEWKKAHAGIEVAVSKAFLDLRTAQSESSDDLAGVRRVASSAESVSGAILDIRTQFHKLNQQIRGEHRFMYTWYDKFLTYFMLLLATLATWGSKIEAAARYLLNYVGGEITQTRVFGWFLSLAAFIGLITLIYLRRELWATLTFRLNRTRVRRLLRRANDRGDRGRVAELEKLLAEPNPTLLQGGLRVAIEAERLNVTKDAPGRESRVRGALRRLFGEVG